jgi:hypothetical protein
MKRLQCQRGTDEINHGGTKFIVNNYTWQVDVDDEVADFVIKDGRAGVSLVEEPKDGDLVCPHCGFISHQRKGLSL